jgi:hypothetical protein
MNKTPGIHPHTYIEILLCGEQRDAYLWQSVNCYYEIETHNLYTYTTCSFCIVISFLAVIVFTLLKI